MKIYVLKNTANEKVYIGKTEKPLDVRFLEHLRDARVGSPRRLYQAIRKHGAAAFFIAELEETSEETVNMRERHFIAEHKSKQYEFGYNMTDGGEGCPGRHVSPETRAKIGAKSKARLDAMTDEERGGTTQAANSAKRGQKEKPSEKSAAQKKRWAEVSAEERRAHALKSRAGMSVEGAQRSITALTNAYSSAREPGKPKEKVVCPHCDKIGGAPIMKRYHFDKCKLK